MINKNISRKIIFIILPYIFSKPNLHKKCHTKKGQDQRKAWFENNKEKTK